jgi:hypothetical protein
MKQARRRRFRKPQPTFHTRGLRPGPDESGELEWISPGDLKPYPGNARLHGNKQIRQLAEAIERFGFTAPVLIDEAGTILAGHARVAAFK